MANTAQEALIAELLGDVGKLHDQLKALPETFRESVAPKLEAIALAIKEAKTSIELTGQAEKVALGNFTAQEKATLRNSFKAALQEEAREALASAAHELAASARIHQDAAQSETCQRWQWIAVAFAGSLLAGAMSFGGSALSVRQTN